MPRPKQIALAFPIGVPYMERITRGVMDHARGRWQLMFTPEATTLPLESLRRNQIDGLITLASTRAEEKRIARLGVPAVNVASALATPLLPNVTVENHSVGRLAAEHLLARGFQRFAYYGLSDTSYGRERGAGFVAAVEQAGFRCSVCHAKSGVDSGRPWLMDLRQLRTWLRRLEPPVGLLAVHDYRARAVLDVCASIGVRVPDDVAVIGVDDDVVACELSTPTLSSVALPGYAIGQQAAQMLEQLMRGRSVAPASRQVLVAATDLVARRSTDVLAVADPKVAEAARLVNERIAEPLNVAQVAQEVGVSRRVLERHFRTVLGMTPHEYLSRARVERAKRMLGAQPPPSLKEVAAACGFSDTRRLNDAFRRLEGASAQQYRRARPAAKR